MPQEECFGELYRLRLEYSGEWMDRIIQRISKLHIEFIEANDSLANGITLHNKGEFTSQLGTHIAIFLTESYIIKAHTHINSDGGISQYNRPINLILNSIDREYTSLINKECINSIVSILNHPHFRLCKSVKDIEASSNFVKDFNLRFETGENLIQE